MNIKSLKTFRIVSAIFLIATMILIFFFSSENDVKSTETSTNVIKTILNFVYPPFKNFSELQRLELINSLQAVVRVGAHFSIFALLGFFSFLTFITYKAIPFKLRLVIISGFCLFYAITDEIHQIFVPGRCGDIRDVCTDFLGSMLSICILTLICKIKIFKKYI